MDIHEVRQIALRLVERSIGLAGWHDLAFTWHRAGMIGSRIGLLSGPEQAICFHPQVSAHGSGKNPFRINAYRVISIMSNRRMRANPLILQGA